MKDIGKIINKSYEILKVKQYKDADLFAFNAMTTKKIINALNSENFTNSGFDYKTSENILNFMIGQFGYLETRMEEPMFRQQNLQYWENLDNSIKYILENMSFEHGKHFASESYIDNLNGNLLKTRFEREELQKFDERYDKFIEPFYNKDYYNDFEQ